MSYALFILRRAQRGLAALPAEDYIRVKRAVGELASRPRPAGCSKLAGREGWRIRVGHYRVIYEIDDGARAVTVLHVGHRKDAYRNL